jgi:regulatory protein
MPLVTRLTGRRDRVKVFVDGEFWAELDAGIAAERGLSEGTALSEEELTEARVAGERPLAMSRALNVLGYRARSARELRERLARAGYLGETVDEVISRLEELGYLNDEEFARELARSEARKYGPRRIYGDLRRAGIEEEAAREVVDEEFAGRSEHEAAREAAQRRYNTVERSDAQVRRVYGFLVRRGYSASICAEVAREYRREADQ